MMKLLPYTLVACLFMLSCSDDGAKKDDGDLEVLDPVAVEKTTDAKIYVHMMPWFETKESNNGTWGIHWKMAYKNPDNMIDPVTQKREIASHYYPLIGPYASGDDDVIEYQLLLMKLSGIDGILIDWYGTLNLHDYPANKRNTERIISLTSKVGLDFAITYEDQTVRAGVDAGVVTDDIAAGRNDMNYIEGQYFAADNYIQVNNKPLLLTFGPQYFQSQSDWTDLFSVLDPKPEFLTLWYEAGETGTNATGEYSWVYQDQTPHNVHLTNFYNRSITGTKMGSAYPGFRDYYKEGGWGNNYFVIEHNGLVTFEQTLDLALSRVNYVQLITWNDYGEGTMIEPTVEFSYGFLTTLQERLGVPYSQADLELVARLYELRKTQTDPSVIKKLDQSFYYLVSLKVDEARSLLSSIP
jgi:hypothetical protein